MAPGRSHSCAMTICDMSSVGDSQIALGEILAPTQHKLSPASKSFIAESGPHTTFTPPCSRPILALLSEKDVMPYNFEKKARVVTSGYVSGYDTPGDGLLPFPEKNLGISPNDEGDMVSAMEVDLFNPKVGCVTPPPPPSPPMCHL